MWDSVNARSEASSRRRLSLSFYRGEAHTAAESRSRNATAADATGLARYLLRNCSLSRHAYFFSGLGPASSRFTKAVTESPVEQRCFGGGCTLESSEPCAPRLAGREGGATRGLESAVVQRSLRCWVPGEWFKAE